MILTNTREMTEEEYSELQDLSVRTVTLDIEVDDRSDGFPEMGAERILSIVAHDNYSGETRGFIDLEGRKISDAFPDGAPDGLDALDVRPEERQMLIAFRAWFQDKDPDLVTGWNADDFDIPYIIERMNEIRGLNPGVLSPEGWSGISQRGEPRIKGRTVYDLLEVYKKNSFTELRSYTLDDVAAEELDAEKIQFGGSFYDLYQNDPERFIEYNTRDVELAVDINAEAGVIEFRDVLRREVGVMFEDSYDNKDFVDMMCRRKLRERGAAGPTRPKFGEEPDSDYEGAFVFDPFEGVEENVVGVDLASLYPYTMAMLNASPETKAPAEHVQLNGNKPTAFDGNRDYPIALAENGQAFTLEEDGILKELVDEAISLKSEYKELRDSAETDEEYEVWSEKYNVAKTLTNSLYGVTGWERFFLYDPDVAEAVTLTGQAVIKRTAEYAESQGYDVLYGDTDSTYLKFPDEWDQEDCLDAAFQLCDELNETVYPELAEGMGIPAEDNLWEIETEVYMERFFQAGKKKRYAYLPTWKDGREVEDPEPKVSGFSSKRSDSAKLTSETEKKIFDAILSGEEGRVSDIVFEAAQEIKPSPEGEEWEKLGIPGGMNKKITDLPAKGQSDAYYAVSCDDNGNCYPQDAHPRASYNANQILGTTFSSGDKPMRVYLKPTYFDPLGRKIDVIAFETGADLNEIEEQLMLDVSRMTDVLLREPLRELLSAIDINVSAAVRGQVQTGLGSF